MSVTTKRVGIIGAGIAGLCTAKTFKRFGYQVTVFEKEADVGGVWSASRRYPGLTTQNPRDTYEYSDFPMPSDYPEWPSMRIRTGRKAGQSERQILNKLQQAGIDRDSASESLKAHRAESGDAERLAALIHIRKKRLGPYTKEADDAQALFQKQMAKLARAGFSLDIIKSILALNSIEEAEELEAQYQCEQSF